MQGRDAKVELEKAGGKKGKRNTIAIPSIRPSSFRRKTCSELPELKIQTVPSSPAELKQKNHPSKRLCAVKKDALLRVAAHTADRQ